MDLKKFKHGFYSVDYYTQMAIDMLNDRPKDKPFYLNVAHIAPHTPWQAPSDLRDQYEAIYQKGWDVLRQERFKRQQEFGLYSKDLKLPPLSEANGVTAAIPAWNDLTDAQRKNEARIMAVYAAMMDKVDQSIGRLVQHLKDIKEYDNTVIIVFSDNGAAYRLSAFNAPARRKWIIPNFKVNADYDHHGQWNSYIGPNPPADDPTKQTGKAWGALSSTPLNYYKSDLYEGGVHVAAFVHYPKAATNGKPSDGVVSVMDIAPTILDMAGVAYPTTYNGKTNTPMDGISWASFLQQGKALDPNRVIAWELDGAKGVRKGKWRLSQARCGQAKNETPKLFDLSKDPFERVNLASKETAAYNDLMSEYNTYAKANNVIEIPYPYCLQ